MARTNFTDIQKAIIYKRDFAMCAFSGKSLWLLDGGAVGDYMPDWVDHFVPASLGGDSSIENGVCASWLYNYNKGANGGRSIYLFSDGLPTPDYFLVNEVVPEDLIARHRRFKNLHLTDWYFNRALLSLCFGLTWLHDPKSESGIDYKRDNVYYAKASFSKVKVWQKLTQAEGVPSLEQRGLLPVPLFDDQKQFLRIREALSHDLILEIMQTLLPYHAANIEFTQGFRNLYSETCQSGYNERVVSAFLTSLAQNTHVTPIIRERITWNVQNLVMRL